MKSKSLVSINDFSKEEQLRILEVAAEFEKNPRQKILMVMLWLLYFSNLQPEPG
jgi:aspartate carbamoyltransferase catalytic subunit